MEVSFPEEEDEDGIAVDREAVTAAVEEPVTPAVDCGEPVVVGLAPVVELKLDVEEDAKVAVEVAVAAVVAEVAILVVAADEVVVVVAAEVVVVVVGPMKAVRKVC